MVINAVLLAILLLCMPTCRASSSLDSMLKALEIAEYWDKVQAERFPLTYNHILSTGYFTTPSARMGCAGDAAMGVAHAPPYLHLNGRIQPFSCLELTTNYRIFQRVADPHLSPHGFGNMADRGANVKMAIVTPEASCYAFPGFAFGIEDFMGSKKFRNIFGVGTYVFPNSGVEISLGWGFGRYTHGPSRGVFGGFNWFPFCTCENRWIKGISLSAEYDPIDYKNPKKEPHPLGRKSRTPINFGLKYNFKEALAFSFGCIRGKEFACSGSIHFNLAAPCGFIPKIKDPLPYASPKNLEPLGYLRSKELMIQEMQFALLEQGIRLKESWIMEDPNCEKWLFLKVINCRFRSEQAFRSRIQCLLAALTPSNVDYIVVVMGTCGVQCQQYIYPRNLLIRFASQTISPFEFDLLTPRKEASPSPPAFATLLYRKPLDLCKARLMPRVENFFGSAKGKYRYALGVKGECEGFLPGNIEYAAALNYTAFSNIHGIGDFDLFNPSQLPNVATDYIRYRQAYSLSLDKLIFQKSFNWGKGFYSRFSFGYFQVNYGGIAFETLCYPACSHFAIGLEGALVKKRNYKGFGFQSKLRQLKGYQQTFHHYTFLNQVFLNLYADFPNLCLFTKVAVGRFLARDIGARFELTRYFSNGIRLTGWMTFTNAEDRMHGGNYYDRGIAVELPLDLFFPRSSRRVWNSGMAAWLRDAGYAITTGRPLFDTINRERRP